MASKRLWKSVGVYEVCGSAFFIVNKGLSPAPVTGMDNILGSQITLQW
jgi:hypothetical protein